MKTAIGVAGVRQLPPMLLTKGATFPCSCGKGIVGETPSIVGVVTKEYEFPCASCGQHYRSTAAGSFSPCGRTSVLPQQVEAQV